MRTFINLGRTSILLALLGASGAACAQSSVTVSGVIDTGLSYATNTGNGTQSTVGVTNSILGVSNIGFRGTEDLGGGLKEALINRRFWRQLRFSNNRGWP